MQSADDATVASVAIDLSHSTPRLLAHTITSASSHEAVEAGMPRPLRRSLMMLAHTQIDRTTVPVLADSLQHHRGGFVIFPPHPRPQTAVRGPHACAVAIPWACVSRCRFAGARTHGAAPRSTRGAAPQPTPQVRLGLGCLMAGCIERAWARSPWAAGLALPFSSPSLS